MTEHTIDTMLLEERRYPPPEDFAAQANAKPEIYDEPFEAFWEREGRERLTWFEPFTELYEWEPPYAKWFLGGTLNVCFNCVDRHVDAGQGGKVAYHWEGEPDGDARAITYSDLQRDVVRFANALKKLGVGKGTATVEDMESSELIFIFGDNPGTNHPRMLTSLQRAKDHGAKIIAVNPLPEVSMMRVINPNPRIAGTF